MLRRYRRNRRLRRLKDVKNPVINIALQCLDRPTDLKDEFSLRQTLDLDNLQVHADAAILAGKFDGIVSKDIRLATLRAYCTMDAAFVFQCLSAMPELLDDQRAVRSLHTYFNRIGQSEYAESLLGAPEFGLKKRPRRQKILEFITPQSASTTKQDKPSFDQDQDLSFDLKTIELERIGPRLTRHLASHDVSTFTNEVISLLDSRKIEIRRKREIVFQAGTILLGCNLEHALAFRSNAANFASDARLLRRLAVELERTGRSEDAISLLSSATDQTSQRLRQSIEKRMKWRLVGYNLDALKPVENYQPVSGRVLYHIHASIDYTTAGYSTRTHHICKSLLELGVDLHVRTRWGYPCDRKEVDLKPEEIVNSVLDGVTYLHDPAVEAFGTYAMEDYAVRSAYSLLRSAIELRPDTIHAASNHSVGFPAAMVARALKIPFVYEMRGLWALSRAAKDEAYRRSDRFQLEMALERHVANAADHVIAITDGLRAQLIDWGIPADKISLAPNCVDAEKFTVQPRNEQLERSLMLNGKVVIGYVGSLLHYEGLNILLDAVSLLPQLLRNNLAVLIVGDGVMRASLEQQAQELGLSHMVQFTGRVPMDVVNDYYSLIDIAPFPRISAEVCEMISPLKPLEAMAMGSVVLASNVRAIAEHVIANKNGLLFEKENAHDLAEKLTELIQHPMMIQELSRDGRSWVEQRRTWNSMAAVIASVYTHCHTSEGLLEWELDVLPSIIDTGRLTGVPLKLEQVMVSAPSTDGLEWLPTASTPAEHWQLMSNSVELTPKLTSSSGEDRFDPWTTEAPLYHDLTLRSGHKCQGSLHIHFQHDLSRASPTVFLCDAKTTESEVHHAVLFGSILVAERTAHLHGYVGVLTELEHINTIVEAIVNGDESHSYQRKENWRRRILKLHPWVRLVESSYDRSHLRQLDSLRYELFVPENSMTNISQFVSQVLCQRVKPTWVTLPPSVQQTGEYLVMINALLVNNIVVHRSLKPLTARAFEYTSDMNEHNGLDFCLNVLISMGVRELHEPTEADRLSVLPVNQRVLIVGHDLKFITPIANTWRSWGVEVTLLKSKTHSGALEVDDQELMHLMSTHDVLFCEWALGNATKISKLRGERPMFVRYHAQELRTDYILDTDFISSDKLSFVSAHMDRFETRLDGQFERIVIPNGIESLSLDVERKDPSGIGMMGITPQSKGLHRALTMLDSLCKSSPSATLKIKGRLPKEYPWMKRRVDENNWYEALLTSFPDLFEQNKIIHEGFTPDVSHFVATSKSVLSFSDHESFHIAPLEGAVGRTLVHMLPWEGAREIHRASWIFESIEEVVNDFLMIETRGCAYEFGCENRQFVMNHYDHRYVAMELYRHANQHQELTRDTVLPTVMNLHPHSRLYPRKIPPAPLMKVRTLVQQDNDLPSAAENLIRVQELCYQQHVLLAHHVDLNLIDGSAIWFASMAEMLAATGVHVVCSIASEAESSPIIQPLLLLDNVTIITPTKMGYVDFGRKLPHDDYVNMVNSLANYLPGQTKVFSRGFDLVQELSQLEGIEVWAYLTDYYAHDDDGAATVKDSTASLVQTICNNGGKILCQTPLIQDELVRLSEMPEHRFVELPPMIPKQGPLPIKEDAHEGAVKIVYAGKIAPLWGVEPLLDAASSEVAVKVIGDKIHNGPADDSTFRSRMTSKLESNVYIDWIHRLPREEVLKHVASADLAWCSRDAYFESQTRELSTKVLECILMGTPPILTRSRLHEELLGRNWPFFVVGPDDFSWREDLSNKLDLSREALKSASDVLQHHSMQYIAQRFESLLHSD
jgi:glycosyltransferase involved in cell wall biosynthesis